MSTILLGYRILAAWLFGVFIALLIGGCSGSPDAWGVNGPPVIDCPVGQKSVIGTSGVAHCIIPGDMVNVVADCTPIACEAYARLSFRSTDEKTREGAAACAAACSAHCDNDAPFEAEQIEKASSAGMKCAYSVQEVVLPLDGTFPCDVCATHFP